MLTTDDLARLRELAAGRKYRHCAIGPDTLIELIRVYAAVLGARNLIPDDMVRDAILASDLYWEEQMVTCTRCNGKGSHHGFGEHGDDPDWCEVCGGPGFTQEGSEEGAMRSALEQFTARLVPLGAGKGES